MASLALTSRHPDVYEPCEDSFALEDALRLSAPLLRRLHPSLCLEVGCGSGYVTACLANILKERDPLPQSLETDSQTGAHTDPPAGGIASVQDTGIAQEVTREAELKERKEREEGEEGKAKTRPPGNLPESAIPSVTSPPPFTPFFLASDISLPAVSTAKATLDAHCVRADVIATDLARALEHRLAGQVDVLLFNPPYVVTPDSEVSSPYSASATPQGSGVNLDTNPPAAADVSKARGDISGGCQLAGGNIAWAWAGGIDGRRVIDRFLPVAARLLSPHGMLFLVTVAENRPREIEAYMASQGFASERVLGKKTEEESLSVLRFWRQA